MGILAFQHCTDTLSNNWECVAGLPLAKGWPDNPPFLLQSQAYQSGGGSFTNNKFYFNFGYNPASTERKYYAIPNGFNRGGTWGEVPSTSKELWYRIYNALNTGTTVNYVGGADIPLVEFFNWDATLGRMKKIADLFSPFASGAGGQLQYRLFTDVEGTETVVRTHLLGNINAYIEYEASTLESWYDIRINLDAVAGFIQVYDYSTTRKAEAIGVTIGTLPITHVWLGGAPLTSFDNNRAQVFSILADVPTFGMYVMPLNGKAEGSQQNQSSGGIAQFSKNWYDWQNHGAPVLTKPDSGNVKYTFTPQNCTDRGLPANYNILTFEYRLAYDCTKMDLGDLPVSSILKFKDTGEEVITPLRTRTANQNSYVTQTPMVYTMRWDQNPKSGNSWQQGDLANIELGIMI